MTSFSNYSLLVLGSKIEDRLVNDMPKKVTRRTLLKKIAGIFMTAIGLGSGGYFYAHKIEPEMLDIQRHKISHPLIPTSFNEIKIVQFSDTHLGFQYTLTQLKELMKKINSIRPDLIFFTGDLMDEPNKYTDSAKIIPLLQKLEARLGKFSIYGNHDHGGYGSDIYKNLMMQSGFTLLQNDYQKIQLPDSSSIYVIGIDDAMLGRPDIALPLRNVPPEAYKILLSHAPDLAEPASHMNIQLQLSGHSHGGQIKIPFYGPLVTPPFASKFHEGFYTVGDSNPLTLYVNRGLGTTRLPFRFMSKPELTVFTLKSES
jgi:uncharacterized protein